MLCVLMKIFSYASAKKKTNSQGFQILHFYRSFSSDSMAVMGFSVKYT